MATMYYALYDLLTTLMAPPGALWLSLRQKHRPLLRRFDPLPPAGLHSPVWIQACSVGEVSTAKPIVQAMEARWPDMPLLLTVSTVAGGKWAQEANPELAQTWFPFDHRVAVNRFIGSVKPRALVLIETEIWPNVIRFSRRQQIPVVVLNGRISDKHFERYRRMASLVRPVFSMLSGVGAQNDEYAERFRDLGVPPSALAITGNTKFDGVRTEGTADLRQRVLEENGIPPDTPILLFGSTRPGDEALAAQCWQTLREAFPTLVLAVAPRHLDRVREILPLFSEPVVRRTELKAGRRLTNERVIIVDTLGELASFYAAATVAVVGGSFYPGVNGHNPLEPAALGIPTVFGPFMRNFIDPARVLVETNGAVQVKAPEDLLATIDRLLNDPTLREDLAIRGRQAVLVNQGAIRRSIDFLEGFIRPS